MKPPPRAKSSSRPLDLDGTVYDGLWTQAVMHAPDEQGFRRAFFATGYVRGNEWDMAGPPVLIEREILSDLLDAPAFEDIKVETRQRARDAMLAGQVMVSMFLMWKYPALLGSRSLGGVSLNKAFHFLRYIGRELEWKYGDGTPFPTGETKIKACWAKYRPVAHFWAALSWNTAIPMGAPMTLFKENLPEFLSAARYFEMFGCEPILDNKGSKKQESILGNDFWRVPDRFRAVMRLPDDTAIFEDSPLTKALRSYAAN